LIFLKVWNGDAGNSETMNVDGAMQWSGSGFVVTILVSEKGLDAKKRASSPRVLVVLNVLSLVHL